MNSLTECIRPCKNMHVSWTKDLGNATKIRQLT